MAISYDQRKQKYESFDDNQKQKWNNMVNNSKEWDVMRQYMSQYNNETGNTPQSNNNSSNFNNQNGTNWQNQTNFDTPTVQKTESQNNNQNNQTYNFWEQRDNFIWSQKEALDADGRRIAALNWKYYDESTWRVVDNNPNVSPDLDQTKFNQDPWKITVQEWTAQQTWKPDYWISTDARLNEMKGNLDHYFSTSPRMFSDRETFNRVFEYNNRDSEAQRQLLDSYWKRKEDMDKASQYTSWESIMNWMNNSEITTDQLNLLKDTNPEAYQKRQELQEEEIKKRIVNDIVPPLLEAISQNMVNMMNNLWIQPQEAEDIEWVYNDTMDRTQAYQTMEDANRTVKRIEEVNNKRTAIMNRYANSTWWTVSDALAAARMQKALAPYDTEMQGLQYQYQDYANLFSQKQAAAYQAAQVRQMQASENQRIWNQRLTALWFAQTAMSYRTPEQQAQLRLQEQQAQNDMQLLQQSRLNDLNRYNQYATAKMQNQLQQELTDLSVEDENQLKANLNNALSDYYKNYGDIIQRSQAQAVDDIIAYAKKKGISVAQAMTENFIKPLQNKPEYKQKVASDYQMLSKQSIGTINWKSVIMTTNPNWSISYQFIDDPESAKSTAKPYDLVDEKVFDVSPQSHNYYTLRDFIDDPTNKEWTYGWQCAKFVNDYLENIWVGRYFWNEDIKTRASWCNSDSAKVWTIAVFDYNNISSDWINHGHVWVVIDTDDKWYWVLESNFDKNNPEKIQKRYVLNWSSSCKWFFDPSKPASAISSIPDAKSVWGLSSSQLNSLAEDYINWTRSYSDIKATYWEDVLNAVWKRASQLTEYGYEKSKIITDPAKIMSAEQSLMSKFNSMNDWNKEALTQINKMQQALDAIAADKKNDKKTLNSASQTIVTAFNKILDPTSVVRESEYARTPEWQSYIDKLQGKYDQIIKWWAWLTYDNLKASVDLAQKFAKAYQDNQNQLAQLIRNQAKTFWLNESNILPIDVIQQLDNSKSTATWPSDPIQAIWEDDYENTYGISYSDTYYLVNG